MVFFFVALCAFIPYVPIRYTQFTFLTHYQFGMSKIDQTIRIGDNEVRLASTDNPSLIPSTTGAPHAQMTHVSFRA